MTPVELERLLVDAAHRRPDLRGELAEVVDPAWFTSWQRRDAFIAGCAADPDVDLFDVARAMAGAGHVGVLEIVAAVDADGRVFDTRHAVAAAGLLGEHHRRRMVRVALSEAERRLDQGQDVDAVLALLGHEVAA